MSNYGNYASTPPRQTTSATIANGASLSGAVDLRPYGTPARLVIPAAWTTANITIQTSYDGVNFNDFYDSVGSEYTITVGGASRSILLPLADFIGVEWIKLRSGTTGTPVNQAADRTISIVCVP